MAIEPRPRCKFRGEPAGRPAGSSPARGLVADRLADRGRQGGRVIGGNEKRPIEAGDIGHPKSMSSTFISARFSAICMQR